MSTAEDFVREQEGTCSIMLNKPPIRVVVGPSRETFYVDPGALRQSSNFFDSELEHFGYNQTEGRECKIEMPEEDPEIFKLYAQWLYTGFIYCKTDELHRNFEKLSLLYALGEKIVDPYFQDEIIAAIIAATRDENAPFGGHTFERQLPGSVTIDTIYQNSSERSPGRRLMVDLYVQHYNSQTMCNDFLKNVDRKFLVDLTKALFKRCKLTEYHSMELEEAEKFPAEYYQHPGEDE